MDIPPVPTGLLEISTEEERVPVAIVHAFCLRGHSVCGEGGQTPTGRPFILFSCNQTPENHSLHFYWRGTGAGVFRRLREGAEDTSCRNRCAGFIFRAIQRGFWLICDHVKLCLRQLEEQKNHLNCVNFFGKARLCALDLCFKSP